MQLLALPGATASTGFHSLHRIPEPSRGWVKASAGPGCQEYPHWHYILDGAAPGRGHCLL